MTEPFEGDMDEYDNPAHWRIANRPDYPLPLRVRVRQVRDAADAADTEEAEDEEQDNEVSGV